MDREAVYEVLPKALAQELVMHVGGSNGLGALGYGMATALSRRALETAARTEGLVLDPAYTAEAFGGLIAAEWFRVT